MVDKLNYKNAVLVDILTHKLNLLSSAITVY